MTAYSKLIAAAVGVVLMLINQNFGVDLTGMEQPLIDVITGLIGAGTVAAVYQVPNKPAA